MNDKKDINVHIGRQIKKAREAVGLTQEKFGELMDLETKSISVIERGVSGISISTLKRICKTLCVSSDSILMNETEDFDMDKVNFFVNRLKQLSPQQLDLALDINNKLLEAFLMQNR